MIDRCFTHCRGIGPRTAARLEKEGYLTWADCLRMPDGIPLGSNKKERLLKTLQASSMMREQGNIGYFVDNFPVRQHWRILDEYIHMASYLDMETTGLSPYDSRISVICVHHLGRSFSFVEGENLDDFPEFIDEVPFLVTFNGTSFDIPFIERFFHIPSLGIPHVDLRWIAWHRGYRGGLKSIERQMGFRRPDNLEDVDGLMAISLYDQWRKGDLNARNKLIDYCIEDTLSTYRVASRLAWEWSGEGKRRRDATFKTGYTGVLDT